MTATELIQQFIQDIGNNTWNLEEVTQYFAEKGIAIDEILGSLVSTPGIHNQNGKIWYSTDVVKMPPCKNKN